VKEERNKGGGREGQKGSRKRRVKTEKGST
jgi:hypothetical protein